MEYGKCNQDSYSFIEKIFRRKIFSIKLCGRRPEPVSRCGNPGRLVFKSQWKQQNLRKRISDLDPLRGPRSEILSLQFYSGLKESKVNHDAVP
jgi:hypothetical protein